jgi:hypothetical protein
MIAHEDNDTLPLAPPNKPVPAIPTVADAAPSSWSLKPRCTWHFFSQQMGEKHHHPLFQHGVVVENIPGAVVEAFADRLLTLQESCTGLGELARYVDARAWLQTKIFDSDGQLARTSLYFKIHGDPQLTAIQELFNVVFRETILPYLEVHGWPIPAHAYPKPSRIDRFREALPTAAEVQELMQCLKTLQASNVGRALLQVWAQGNSDYVDDPVLRMRVRGEVEVTMGDDKEGLATHMVHLDQYLCQSAHAPIMFYLNHL